MSANALTYFSSGSADDRYDDVVMTHVISFDVKVWDPGAPVFDVPVAPTSNGGAVASTITTSIGPGDAGYNNVLVWFMANAASIGPQSANVANVSFGAYVDLNYMQRAAAVDPYNSLFNQFPAAPSSKTTGAGYYPVISSATGNYEVALRKLETKAKVAVGSLPRPHFAGPGDPRSGIYGLWPGNPTLALPVPLGAPATAVRTVATQSGETISTSRPIASVYDTWSTHYECDGVANNIDRNYGVGGSAGVPLNPFYNATSGTFVIDPLTNGVDDDGINGIDDPGEAEAPPPYPHPLRGIQIKIRAFEADTKQIREVTLTHNFLPE
jgi:hypothetical protein